MDALIKRQKNGFLISVYVQPRAAKNTIAGVHDQALKIRLTAPPVDGAANKMCLQFLAKQLNVPKSALQIESGHSSRHKTILCRCDQAKGSKIEFARVKTALEALYKA
ncbi:MAG: YggU family protein [Desulfobacterales bacterium]|nr:YggU family protein [Desulfobacterales bacterium]